MRGMSGQWAFLGRISGMGVGRKCNSAENWNWSALMSALIFLVMASGHTKIANVKQL